MPAKNAAQVTKSVNPTSDVRVEEELATVGDQELKLRTVRGTSDLEVYYEQGGAVPKECRGVFLTKRVAETAISRAKERMALERENSAEYQKKLKLNQQRKEGEPSLFKEPEAK